MKVELVLCIMFAAVIATVAAVGYYAIYLHPAIYMDDIDRVFDVYYGEGKTYVLTWGQGKYVFDEVLNCFIVDHGYEICYIRLSQGTRLCRLVNCTDLGEYVK